MEWGGNLDEEQTGFMNSPGDEFLECRTLTTGNYTQDVAAIDFAAVNVNGQLEMVYQFGSEEYIEFVSDNIECFNDALLILVNSRISSLLPNCTEIIGVQSVHPEIPVGEYQCLTYELPSKNDFLYLNNIVGASPPQVEYNGLIRWLKMHVLFSSNNLFNFRVVLGDVNDDR